MCQINLVLVPCGSFWRPIAGALDLIQVVHDDDVTMVEHLVEVFFFNAECEAKVNALEDTLCQKGSQICLPK